jgi:pilus assembly protein Flp/PilA
MNSWTLPRNLTARLGAACIRVRETLIRPLDRDLSHRQEGQGMVEYALILTLIVIVLILVVSTIGSKVKNAFSNVSNGFNS